MVCPKFWVEYFILIYNCCWELMKSMGGHGSFVPAIYDEGDDGWTLCEWLS
jgi:hypothetical protein